MPSVPMLIPSETPMVLKRMPTRPAAVTPFFTSSASLLRCMLQVLPSYQTLAMPIWALFRSSGERPVPRSMAWLPPWLLGWVMWEENLLRLVIGQGTGDRGTGDRGQELLGP